jgi:hypothetical protein
VSAATASIPAVEVPRGGGHAAITSRSYPGVYAGQIIERYNVGGWP